MSAVIAFSLTCLAILLSSLVERIAQGLPVLAGTWNVVMVAPQGSRPPWQLTDAITLAAALAIAPLLLLRGIAAPASARGQGPPPKDWQEFKSGNSRNLTLVDRAECCMFPPYLRGSSEENPLIWKGSGARLEEEELEAVIEGLDPQTRRPLRQLAKRLALDDVSALVWLSEKTAGPLVRSSA